MLITRLVNYNNIFNLNLIIKQLVKNVIFIKKIGYTLKNIEFINFYQHKLAIIANSYFF